MSRIFELFMLGLALLVVGLMFWPVLVFVGFWGGLYLLLKKLSGRSYD